MKKATLYFLFIFLGLSLFGRDTMLFKIVTSPKPIRNLLNFNGKVIAYRYDGFYEFDGESFYKTSLGPNDLTFESENNDIWAKLVNPNLKFAHVQLSNEGIYWVLIKNRFIYGFKIIDKINKIFPHYAIRGIYVKNDSIITSTYKGFYKGLNRIHPNELDFSNTNFAEHNGFLYFAANNNKLFRMRTNGGSLEQLEGKNVFNEINNIAVLHFFNGIMYVGGEKGFGKYSKNKGFEIIQSGLEVNNLHIINGKLWLATSSGIYIYENGKLNRFTNIISSTGLFQMDEKILSTGFEGLWVFDLKRSNPVNLLKGTLFETLETDAVYSDIHGNLWISTVNGILRYNRKLKSIKTYLEGIEFNRRSYFFNGDQVYFGSNSIGLVYFDVKDLISDDTSLDAKGNNLFLYYFIAILSFLIFIVILFLKVKNPRQNLYSRPIKKDVKSEDEIFSNLEVFIKENLNTIDVEMIRVESGLTKYSFYAKFEKYFGKKPKQYISDLKMEQLRK